VVIPKTIGKNYCFFFLLVTRMAIALKTMTERTIVMDVMPVCEGAGDTSMDPVSDA
jgi:hypothetical protein